MSSRLKGITQPAAGPFSDRREPDVRRVDLHCHSSASCEAGEAMLAAIDCPESYSAPEEVYAQAKRRGMDFVTLTDHDSHHRRPDLSATSPTSSSAKNSPATSPKTTARCTCWSGASAPNEHDAPAGRSRGTSTRWPRYIDRQAARPLRRPPDLPAERPAGALAPGAAGAAVQGVRDAQRRPQRPAPRGVRAAARFPDGRGSGEAVGRPPVGAAVARAARQGPHRRQRRPRPVQHRPHVDRIPRRRRHRRRRSSSAYAPAAAGPAARPGRA